MRTRNDIMKTRDDIMKTIDDIMRTRDDIMRTKDDITRTRDDIMKTRDDIMRTRDDIMRTRDGLTVQHSCATTWLCLVAVTMVAATFLLATSNPLPSRDMTTLCKVNCYWTCIILRKGLLVQNSNCTGAWELYYSRSKLNSSPVILYFHFVRLWSFVSNPI